MKKSYSKIRHIQESNLKLEKRYLKESVTAPEVVASTRDGQRQLHYQVVQNPDNTFTIQLMMDGKTAPATPNGASELNIMQSMKFRGFKNLYVTKQEAIDAAKNHAQNIYPKQTDTTKPQHLQRYND